MPLAAHETLLRLIPGHQPHLDGPTELTADGLGEIHIGAAGFSVFEKLVRAKILVAKKTNGCAEAANDTRKRR